jgi:hypothetical protein
LLLKKNNRKRYLAVYLAASGLQYHDLAFFYKYFGSSTPVTLWKAVEDVKREHIIAVRTFQLGSHLDRIDYDSLQDLFQNLGNDRL